MKKLAILLVTAFVALALTACAGTMGGDTKVKCPACGNEFAPAAGGPA
jgi:hypothetical protein